MPYFETSDLRFNSHQLLEPLIELAKQRGIHPDKALKGTKVFYKDFKAQGHLSSYEELEQIITNISKHELSQDISFVLGQHLLHNLCAKYASYLFHCIDLKALLVACKQLENDLFPYFSTRILREQQAIHLLINPAVSEPSSCTYQFFLEVWLSLVSGFINWRFCELEIQIQLPYATPRHLEHYHVMHTSKLSFGHRTCAVVINKNMLHTRQRDAVEALQSNLTSLQPCLSMGFLSYAEAFLIQYPKACLEDLANHFMVSEATMKRKLKQHNSQFSGLRDRVLSQQAAFCIQQQGYSNAQVAKALAFNDLPNFRRTFKRWFGVTPSELRKTLKV
ncbi:helix-turn-helix transcriptional regulator [Pseudoalteromonas luteoviolacea]|uniref:HTH araC/xylS-type domain-containing protein n=1 Tax=Pseudoalteromonas luteoviolacea S4054 TaxID=1129367 RepID=A0A0F6A9M6_9GAMM|nr:helix-turn-helix transcriptional regulator [Pseudoalteromonas luteoviolacea]AOT08619.1 hypothetical protein S4054249_12480 [Pseudoalteromonas luteoviolacea]AOT13534.1 hypothetical protein S40542_12455 [Pseudoalteromonas luteoviolacea]AOT18447.1 hypothetical protein S4054_12455 [Pseudoalteromonas luteoviolacea]KKE82556.1 hypothetical protein N479_18280 [Pseudoalteromonas luteoviolacea S4054]KZN72094.1 hypothetical protein N481_16920 [Pseudoalteromonas luteoviolacea S4047-1]